MGFRSLKALYFSMRAISIRKDDTISIGFVVKFREVSNVFFLIRQLLSSLIKKQKRKVT